MNKYKIIDYELNIKKLTIDRHCGITEHLFYIYDIKTIGEIKKDKDGEKLLMPAMSLWNIY